MKIDRVIYQKAFVVGPYLQEKIGMEAQIDDGENVQEKMLVLKNLVEDFHEKNKPVENGQMDDLLALSYHVGHTIKSLDIKAEKGTEEALIADINSCNDRGLLETYRLLSKKTPALQEAYDNKLKELS